MLNSALFTAEALFDMMAYTLSMKHHEICGIGRVQTDQADIQYVSDIIILPQEVTGGTVNVTVEAMEAFFETIPEEQHPEWCFNWHSHVKMGVSPSGTDTDNYKGFADLFGMFMPFIVNQMWDYNGWVYQAKPFHTISPVSDVWLYEWKGSLARRSFTIPKANQISNLYYYWSAMNGEFSDERTNFIQAEINEKVRTRTPSTYSYPRSGYGQGGVGGVGGSNSGNVSPGRLNPPANAQQITTSTNPTSNGGSTASNGHTTIYGPDNRPYQPQQGGSHGQTQKQETGSGSSADSSPEEGWEELKSLIELDSGDDNDDGAVMVYHPKFPNEGDIDSFADTMGLAWDATWKSYVPRAAGKDIDEMYSLSELGLILMQNNYPQLFANERIIRTEYEVAFKLREAYRKMATEGRKGGQTPPKSELAQSKPNDDVEEVYQGPKEEMELPIECKDIQEAYTLQDRCAQPTRIQMRQNGIFLVAEIDPAVAETPEVAPEEAQIQEGDAFQAQLTEAVEGTLLDDKVASEVVAKAEEDVSDQAVAQAEADEKATKKESKKSDKKEKEVA